MSITSDRWNIKWPLVWKYKTVYSNSYSKEGRTYPSIHVYHIVYDSICFEEYSCFPNFVLRKKKEENTGVNCFSWFNYVSLLISLQTNYFTQNDHMFASLNNVVILLEVLSFLENKQYANITKFSNSLRKIWD